MHFYDGHNPDLLLGGLIQNGSVTEKNFLDMLGILLIVEAPIQVQERVSGHLVSRSENPLQAGTYNINYKGNQS